MALLSARKILLAAMSGTMLTASFPPGKLSFMAWFAFVPLLIALKNERPSTAFRLGFITGLVHYLTLIYWIIIVLKTYGGLNIIVSITILIFLCLYLSLYPALFSALAGYLKDSRFQALITAGIWVSLEYMRGLLLTGFPWCLLGYSQFRYLYLIQIADIVGVYGISFLILLTNVLIYIVFFKGVPGAGKRYLGLEILLLLAFLSVSLLYGHYQLSKKDEITEFRDPIRVAVVQGNIDQSLKWNHLYQQETLNIYRRLTETTYGFKPHLIIWPETALPFFFQHGGEFAEEVYSISRESGARIIFGSPAYQIIEDSAIYYNRIYWLSGKDRSTGFYDKVHLVPFGEYVPLKRLLPFVHRLVPAAGDFSPGSETAPLEIPGLTAGPLICYEAIFPELSRVQVKKGSVLLVNLTNDAWFGMSSAPYQHLSMALFRAVENRRPLVRAANTGFSAFMDAKGRITARSDLFKEEVLMGKINTGNTSLTFYCKYGDIFVYVIMILCLIKFLYELCYHRLKTQ
jgi:apolipoprotein N-acyltransferase